MLVKKGNKRLILIAVMVLALCVDSSVGDGTPGFESFFQPNIQYKFNVKLMSIYCTTLEMITVGILMWLPSWLLVMFLKLRPNVWNLRKLFIDGVAAEAFQFSLTSVTS